jgi:hypothetical protein
MKTGSDRDSGLTRPRNQVTIPVQLARVRVGSPLTTAILCFLVAVFFLYCTWPGIFIGFDNDDVTNLYRSLQEPATKVLIANLVPFTTFYRPSGAAYYRACYALFGWNPGAFRAITYALFLANLLLIYLFARALTKSREVALLSAILYTFHGRLRQLYMSNGAVYDVLCTTLTLLTLLCYIRWKESGARLRLPHYLLLTFLFIAALNAKEMAAVVPLLLFLFEWMSRSPVSLRTRSLIGWLLLLSLLAFWGKQRAGSLFNQHPLYTPSYTPGRLLDNERMILDELLYLPPGSVNTTGVAIFYVGLFGIAGISRRKEIWFSACFFSLAQLPVIFIPYRGFFVMYLPLAGLAIYLASLLVLVRDRLLSKIVHGQPIPFAAERLLSVALLIAVIPLGRNRDPMTSLTPVDPAMAYIDATYGDIVRLKEPIPKGAKVLLLNSRYPEDNWGPLMMMRLLYRDPTLWVDRPSMMNPKPGRRAWSNYDRVIDFDGTSLQVLQRKSSPAAARLNLPR